MKNSTLLRLFFISIGLPLTCASSSSAITSSTSSSSTSSALTSIPKRKPASLLVNTTNTAPAVQLQDQSILVQSDHEESQVSERDEQTKRFEELISSKQYRQMAKLGNGMNDEELLKCLCQGVTSPDHFKGLYGYLERRNMVSGFLARGEMVVVREVIFETGLLETDDLGRCDSIYDAVALSFKEDRHERVACLFEAAKERPAWGYWFNRFVDSFFQRYPPEENSMPLKRFLTLHGKEFSEKHPAIFEAICRILVERLKWQLGNLASQKLLVDFVGQPSLLTPVAYAWGFLDIANDEDRANFIKNGYKEAIEEGLKEGYRHGGEELWAVMVSKYPKQFSGEYPITDEARTTALKDLPTKQDLEEEWAEKNAPILLKHLEMLVTELPIAKVLLPIIAEYAITWIIV